MPNSLQSMTLRVAITCMAACLMAIGPYLHYSRQVKNGENAALQIKPNTEVSFSHLPYIGDIPDFESISDVRNKKTAFFDFLRPKVILENQRINKERAFLLSLNVEQITKEQKEYAEHLAALYSHPLNDGQVDKSWLDEMLKRVNVLPEALVLIQAANESAWGTSRFATQANNLFGQWCYKKGCGIVPAQRESGRMHEVKKFASVQESVYAYVMNINRNPAYENLRELRTSLAEKNKDLLSVATASELISGLHAYSERGVDYVKDLRSMIHDNNVYWTQKNNG